jgi:hypothetical protein
LRTLFPQCYGTGKLHRSALWIFASACAIALLAYGFYYVSASREIAIHRELALYKAASDAIVIRASENRSINSDEYAELVEIALSQFSSNAESGSTGDTENKPVRWHLGLLRGDYEMTERELEILTFTVEIVQGDWDNARVEVPARALADFALQKSGLVTVDEFTQKIEDEVERRKNSASTTAAESTTDLPKEITIVPPNTESGDAPPTLSPELNFEVGLEPFREPRELFPIERDMEPPVGSIGIEREAEWMGEIMDHLDDLEVGID